MSTDAHPPPQEQKQQRPLRVAVLTSGGDSAGMNAAVRAVVKQAIVRYLIRSSFLLEIFLFGSIYLYLPLESVGFKLMDHAQGMRNLHCPRRLRRTRTGK
jgi:hypothetical protein